MSNPIYNLRNIYSSGRAGFEGKLGLTLRTSVYPAPELFEGDTVVLHDGTTHEIVGKFDLLDKGEITFLTDTDYIGGASIPDTGTMQKVSIDPLFGSSGTDTSVVTPNPTASELEAATTTTTTSSTSSTMSDTTKMWLYVGGAIALIVAAYFIWKKYK